MAIFEFRDYRKAFARLFEKQRKEKTGWSAIRLAEKIRVQPSYITNVVKGRAHFSSDQIYALGAELNLDQNEVYYLDLLMEHERSELPIRKEKLGAEIQKIRDKHVRGERYLQAKENTLSAADKERYYLDPNIELLHLYLGTKKVPKDIGKIADTWDFEPDYVQQIVVFLEKTGLVKSTNKGWQIESSHQHLPRTSPLCKPHEVLKRLRAIDIIQRRSSDKFYSFNGTLTITDETRLQIQARFLKFLQECEQLAVDSEPEGIYNLQFDMFPWIE